jgi:hypothetical protein
MPRLEAQGAQRREVITGFCSDEHLVSASLKRSPEDLLRRTLRMVVGHVEEVHASVDRSMHGLDRLSIVAVVQPTTE